jgi:hypothetical protein
MSYPIYSRAEVVRLIQSADSPLTSLTNAFEIYRSGLGNGNWHEEMSSGMRFCNDDLEVQVQQCIKHDVQYIQNGDQADKRHWILVLEEGVKSAERSSGFD